MEIQESETSLKNAIDYCECRICLNTATEPVVTWCGHLFCWPCLYQWLQHHSKGKACPVCREEVTIKDVTPIYGAGSSDDLHDPDTKCCIVKIPPRPTARRSVKQSAAFYTRHMFRLFQNSVNPSTPESGQSPSDARPTTTRIFSDRNLFWTARMNAD